METQNCKKCGKLFYYISGYQLCKECKEKDEEDYLRVREYIHEHQGAKIDEVVEKVEVTRGQILRYLREERLEIYEESNALLFCDMCGVSIKKGRYCDLCKARIKKELNIDLNNAASFADKEEKKILFLKYGGKDED